MSDSFLIVDTATILHLHAAGGRDAIWQLLNTGRDVMIPKDVLDEPDRKTDGVPGIVVI